MFRHIAVFTIGLAAIANLNAGYIQIGGNTGLTATNSNGTITTTGSFAEGTYSGSVFQGTSSTIAETGSGVLCAGATQSTCTATTGAPSGEPSNEFATASGVTFSMINGDSNSNVWAAPNTGTSSITIPIGIFGVTNVYTMLNDEYGVVGGTPTTVQFNFSNGSYESFTLVNGQTIADSFDCIGGTCPTYATTLSGGTYAETAGTDTGGTVSAFEVWAGTYGGPGTGAYNNTNGDINLDAQNFSLGSTAAGLTLTNVVITDTAGGTVKVSRDELSAITVQTTPEPSTIFLVTAGIGAVGLLRRRRVRQ